jgi:hypothetical protein
MITMIARNDGLEDTAVDTHTVTAVAAVKNPPSCLKLTKKNTVSKEQRARGGETI